MKLLIIAIRVLQFKYYDSDDHPDIKQCMLLSTVVTSFNLCWYSRLVTDAAT